MSRVTITECNITCHRVPSQLEGKLSNGMVFYARSRYSGMSIGIAETMQEAVMGDGPINFSGNIATDRFSCVPVQDLISATKAFIACIQWDGVY